MKPLLPALLLLLAAPTSAADMASALAASAQFQIDYAQCLALNHQVETMPCPGNGDLPSMQKCADKERRLAEQGKLVCARAMTDLFLSEGVGQAIISPSN